MTQEEINADRREWRRMLKAAHICRDCKGQDAYTLGGRTYCAECAAKRAAWQRERRGRDGGEGNRLETQRRRAKRTEKGVCIYCGRRKARDGLKTCKLCTVHLNRLCREAKIENGMNWPRGTNGYCWQCNKRKVMEGRRLCEECYGMKLRILGGMSPERQAEGRKKVKEGWTW